MRALSIASTGMAAQQTNVETIANNLANMNTTGFKQQRAEFQDLLYQNIQTPGAQTSDQGTYAPNGIQIGAGVRTAAIYRITTQGDLQSTSNPYDVAIQGAGYFRIQQADGTDAYTRSGNFSLSPQGQLVTQDGVQVAGDGGAITVNGVNASISPDGSVRASGLTVGRLQVVRIDDPNTLERVAGTRFKLAQGQPQPAQNDSAQMVPQALEMSNVSAVTSMVDVMVTNRAFEAYTEQLRALLG